MFSPLPWFQCEKALLVITVAIHGTAVLILVQSNNLHSIRSINMLNEWFAVHPQLHCQLPKGRSHPLNLDYSSKLHLHTAWT